MMMGKLPSTSDVLNPSSKKDTAITKIHADYKSETTLSKYVWDNGLNPTPNVTWKFLKNCSVYKTGNKSCDLCMSKKIHIIKNLHKKNIINKRTDIGNKCPHKRKCMFKRAVI